MACCPRMENCMTNIRHSKYCTFLVSLFATILSFADPVTDILTLVEFYRDDHKTWFALGLAFLVLPCLAFFVLMRMFKSFPGEVYLCGLNPFSSAWVRLKICWSNFRKCCWGANSNDEVLNEHSNWAVLLEAVFESAPQFIIQLYAMSVQQEPVSIIQMISLPVSLLSLGWAFTAFDSDSKSRPVEGIIVLRNVKQTVVLFVNYLFLLSSRLFAVTFFTITYKWWIIIVLIIHNVSLLIVDTIWSFRITGDFKGCSGYVEVAMSVLSFCLNWLRDDMSPVMHIRDTDKKEARVKQRMLWLLLSNILFVIENCTMIIIFYWFSPLSNTWYSLPVTVCVCSFSVIGAVARVAQVYFVTKEPNRRNNVNRPVPEKENTTKVNNEPNNGSIKGVTPFDMMAEYVKLVTNQPGQSTKGDSRSGMMKEYKYVSYV